MSELYDWLTSPVTMRVIAVSIATNVACALVGSFLVLRRMSLMGDALSHAVLPGLVLAYLWTGSMGILPMFIGAILAGMLTTFLTQTLHQYGHVPEDASMGVVFTSLFALGVVLLKRYAGNIHFDVACVYEGSLGLVATDVVTVAGWNVPRTLLTIGPVLLLNFGLILLLWKEFKLSTFDPALATSMGYPATAMHYLLMLLVALTAMASFEAVGSILVVAMLIVPPATAQLLVNRLWQVLAVACGLAVVIAIAGYAAASYWDVAPAGAMTVVAGALFAVTVFISPQQGLIASLWRNTRLSLQILSEDLLAMIYRVDERGAKRPLDVETAVRALDDGWLARLALARLRRADKVIVQNGALRLTDPGRQEARRLVRSHRLWEAYLHEHLGLPVDHVHEPAHRVEHFVSEELRLQLEEALRDSTQDPHGREIPG
ncbi:MAG: metal ABC transporter permease [Pirellulales bacterium]